MCNLFLWCLGCLIKLKAAVSGQWPLTFPDEAFCHISFALRPVAADPGQYIAICVESMESLNLHLQTSCHIWTSRHLCVR